jgi:hypothetical protein
MLDILDIMSCFGILDIMDFYPGQDGLVDLPTSWTVGYTGNDGLLDILT